MIWDTKPVQTTDAFFMSYSPQSRKCTPIWHHTWSHSLSLQNRTGKLGEKTITVC